jgi:fructose-bisphosphate aldolase class 1
VASFSRALLAGLTAQQSPAEFNALLDATIQSIYEASTTKSGDDRNAGEESVAGPRFTQTGGGL